MPTTHEILQRLRAAFELEVEFDIEDNREAEEGPQGCVDELLATVPALARETEYVSLLSLAGGLHASDPNNFSFGLFGFDEPGYGITSLYEGEPLDGSFFRFGDVMVPEFEENLVFAFDLRGNDRTVFASPGSDSRYEPYAESFAALVEKMIDFAARRRRK